MTARLVQGGAENGEKTSGKGKAARSDAQKNAAGGLGGIGSGSFKMTPGLPIDIDARQLDIDDNRRLAVFSGDVQAKQGDFKIEAQSLTAHFSGPLGLLDEQGGTTERQPAELIRVKALDEVKITSSGGRSATGDWAEFDIAKNIAVVGGEVRLIQGGSSVRGDRLTINMTTGASVIDNAPGRAGTGWATMLAPGGAEAVGKKAKRKTRGKDGKKAMVPPQGIPIRGGRPSAVFFPQNIKGGTKTKPKKAKGAAKNKEKPSQRGAPSNATSGWQTVTQPKP